MSAAWCRTGASPTKGPPSWQRPPIPTPPSSTTAGPSSSPGAAAHRSSRRSHRWGWSAYGWLPIRSVGPSRGIPAAARRPAPVRALDPVVDHPAQPRSGVAEAGDPNTGALILRAADLAPDAALVSVPAFADELPANPAPRRGARGRWSREDTGQRGRIVPRGGCRRGLGRHRRRPSLSPGCRARSVPGVRADAG